MSSREVKWFCKFYSLIARVLDILSNIFLYSKRLRELGFWFDGKTYSGNRRGKSRRLVFILNGFIGCYFVGEKMVPSIIKCYLFISDNWYVYLRGYSCVAGCIVSHPHLNRTNEIHQNSFQNENQKHFYMQNLANLFGLFKCRL